MANTERRAAAVAALLAVGVLACQPSVQRREPPRVELSDDDPAVAKAVAAACDAVRRSPQSAEVWGQLGMKLYAHEFADDAAMDCFTQAERLNPREARWPYFRARLLAQSAPESAVAEYERAAALCDGEANNAVRMDWGELLLRLGRLDDAQAQFTRLLQRDAAQARAHLGLARVAFARDHFPESAEHLARIVDDARTRKAAHTLLAQVRARQGEKSAAAEETRLAAAAPADAPWANPFYEELLRLRIGWRALLARVDQLLAENRAEDALAVLRKMVREYPELDWTWLLTGRALILRRDLAGAEQALRKAIALSPRSADAQFYLGVSLYLQNERREAADCFRRATEIEPAGAAAHLNLGSCLAEEGETDKAIESLRMALRCRPDYVDALVSLGEVLAKKGQTVEAITHLRAALELDPANATAGKLLRELDKPGRAD